MAAEEWAQELARHLGDRMISLTPFARTLGRVKFRPEAAREVFRAVHDDLGFDHLSMVGGIDWVDRREVIYTLWSDRRVAYLFLSADLVGEAPHIETASAVWPGANWHERETWELVGIQFDHHPDLRHLLMPDGYAFNPLLRSFKLHEPEELEVKTRHV